MQRHKSIAAVMIGLIIFPVTAFAQSSLAIPKIGTEALQTNDDATLPLDKPYSKLTWLQQKIVRSWYEGLGDNDEPPYPIDGLQAIFSEIAKVQRKVPVAGRFFASAHIDTRGHATNVAIYALPDPRLKDVLAYILLKTEYKPGKCNGKSCEMDFPIEANFELPASASPLK